MLLVLLSFSPVTGFARVPSAMQRPEYALMVRWRIGQAGHRAAEGDRSARLDATRREGRHDRPYAAAVVALIVAIAPDLIGTSPTVVGQISTLDAALPVRRQRSRSPWPATCSRI